MGYNACLCPSRKPPTRLIRADTFGRATRRPRSLKAGDLFTLLDLCVSSLRRGHANILCIVPMLTDDPRRESTLKAGEGSISVGLHFA